MKEVLVLFFVILNVTHFSQIYNDILVYEGDTYLIRPSPSFGFVSYGQEYTEDYYFKGSYEIVDGELTLKKILKKHKSLKKDTVSIELSEIGSVYERTAKFKLIKVLNPKDIEEKVIKTGAFVGYTIPIILQFENGDLMIEDCAEENCIHTGKVGFLDFIDFGDMPIDFEIYNKNNDLVLWGNTENYWDYNEFGPIVSIKPGIYSIVVYCDGCGESSSDLTQYFWNVKVENCKRVYIPMRHGRLNNYFNGYSNDDKTFLGCDFIYGNSKLASDKLDEVNAFGFSFFSGAESFIGLRSRVSLIGIIGGEYSANVMQHSVSFNGKESWLNSYSYLSANFTTGVRNYFGSYKTYNGQRFFIEASVVYRLPLIFRNVQRFGDQKKSIPRLNNFADLSIQGKIGVINGISMFCQYRLFDIVKKNLTQLASLQIGLSIMVDN